MFNVKTETSVEFQGKKYPSLSALLTARQLLGANRMRFSKTNQSLSQGINNAYTLTGRILDELLAESLGQNASSVVNTPGHGVIFDNIVVNSDGTFQVSENKLVSAITNAEGVVQSVSPISVAGGSGINISPGVKTIFTGETLDITNITLTPGAITSKADVSNALATVEVSFTKDFINKLLQNRDNQAELKKILNSNRSKAAIALRKNFELKSGDIRVLLNINGKAVVRSIGWKWSDIVNNPKAKISIIPDPNGGINFNIYFTSALVKEALNKTEVILNEKNLELSEELAQTLAKEFAALSPNVVEFLNGYSISLTRTYDVGSLLVSKGRIVDNTKIKRVGEKPTAQRFISNAQWTMLTQRRLGETMSRFGEPYPPDIKERSGRFRRSVEVTANYRTRMLAYTYNPLYRALEHYGYHPELQVERAIRDVAQELFTTRFHVVRRGALA